jgi:hypothetical protein
MLAGTINEARDLVRFAIAIILSCLVLSCLVLESQNRCLALDKKVRDGVACVVFLRTELVYTLLQSKRTGWSGG